MSFNPGGGALSGASDVALSSPANDQVLTWETATAKWRNKTPGAGGGGKRPPYLIVASNQAPAAVKAAADWVCDGNGDQNEINLAITAAAAAVADSGFSGTSGNGKVVLSGGAFDINTPILMRTGVELEGMGMLTELRARSITTGAQSIIALVDGNAHLTRVTNMWLNGNGAGGNAHAIHYDSTDASFGSRPNSNPDAGHWIDHLYIFNTASGKHGIYTTGNSGGARGMKIGSIRMFYILGNGVHLQGSSDTHLTDVEVSTDGSGTHGFVISSGNCVLNQCKGWYCEGDGFQITSSRAALSNCSAQDNGRWGFNVTGGNCSITGGQADSNQRVDNLGGGININSSDINISGMSVFDRAQSTQRQTRGIVFTGTPTSARVDANVSVASGTAHVVGTYTGSGNLISIVRDGTTPIVHGF